MMAELKKIWRRQKEPTMCWAWTVNLRVPKGGEEEPKEKDEKQWINGCRDVSHQQHLKGQRPKDLERCWR